MSQFNKSGVIQTLANVDSLVPTRKVFFVFVIVSFLCGFGGFCYWGFVVVVLYLSVSLACF